MLDDSDNPDMGERGKDEDSELSMLRRSVLKASGTAAFLGTTTVAGASSETQSNVWSVELDENEKTKLEIADTDGDGTAEVGITSASGHGPTSYGIVDQGEWVWKERSSAVIHATTSGDVNGDGNPEIIFRAKVGPVWVRPYTHDGSYLWKGDMPDWPGNAVAIDYDNDGKDEVAALSGYNGHFRVFDDDGSIEWDIKSSGLVDKLLDFRNVTGDQVPELLTPTGRNFENTGTGLQLVRQTGKNSAERVWKYGPTERVRAKFSDLDDDGSLEVLVAYPETGEVHAVDTDGSQMWTESIGVSGGRAAIFDVDGDGTLDAVLWSGTSVTVLNGSSRATDSFSTESDVQRVEPFADGQLIVVTNDRVGIATPDSGIGDSRSTSREVLDVAAGDVDGDGATEVVIGFPDEVVAASDLASDSGTVSADLSLEDIRPVQAVFNPDIDEDGQIDLVKNKKTALLLRIEGTNVGRLSQTIEIEIESPWGSKTIELEPSEYLDQQLNDEPIDDLIVKPDTVGSATVTATVDPESKIEETNDKNNTLSKDISVKDTGEFSIAYKYMDTTQNEDITYSSPNNSKYLEHIEKSNEFIKATFPIAESNYKSQNKGQFLGNETEMIGLIDDLTNLDYLRYKYDVDRMISVATSEYFNYHGISTLGLTHPSVDSAIVNDGIWIAAAHEIGHTFGLYEDTEEYNIEERSSPDTGNGYWVNRKERIYSREAFMENGDKDELHETLNNRWISNDSNYQGDLQDYNQIFESLHSREDNDTVQQTVIYLKGIIHEDGTLDASNWDLIKDGKVSSTKSGSYRCTGLNTDDEIVVEKEFSAPFRLNTLGGTESPIQTDITGFSFAIDYPREMQKLEIRNENKVLAEFDPTTKLLSDAIDLIPDNGYMNNPERRRNTLHNKIDAMKNSIDSGEFQGAKQKLENDIKDKVEKRVKDSYATDSIEELSKEDVLEIIDEMISRLEALSQENKGKGGDDNNKAKSG